MPGQNHLPRKHFHGRNLRMGRHSELGRPYLVTTVTRERVPLFSIWDNAVACARVLHRMPADGDVAPLAWVIMPDHVHWLFTLERGQIAGALRLFKSRAARAVNIVRGSADSVWQRGYHDHAVRREEDLRVLARYIVANPLRAGLCERIGDYPFWDAVWL